MNSIEVLWDCSLRECSLKGWSLGRRFHCRAGDNQMEQFLDLAAGTAELQSFQNKFFKIWTPDATKKVTHTDCVPFHGGSIDRSWMGCQWSQKDCQPQGHKTLPDEVYVLQCIACNWLWSISQYAGQTFQIACNPVMQTEVTSGTGCMKIRIVFHSFLLEPHFKDGSYKPPAPTDFLMTSILNFVNALPSWVSAEESTCPLVHILLYFLHLPTSIYPKSLLREKKIWLNFKHSSLNSWWECLSQYVD